MVKRSVNPRGVILKKSTLVKARKAAGYSQKDLASKIGKKIISAWRAENNHSIDVTTARLIAGAVKVPLPLLIRKSA